MVKGKRRSIAEAYFWDEDEDENETKKQSKSRRGAKAKTEAEADEDVYSAMQDEQPAAKRPRRSSVVLRSDAPDDAPKEVRSSKRGKKLKSRVPVDDDAAAESATAEAADADSVPLDNPAAEAPKKKKKSKKNKKKAPKPQDVESDAMEDVAAEAVPETEEAPEESSEVVNELQHDGHEDEAEEQKAEDEAAGTAAAVAVPEEVVEEVVPPKSFLRRASRRTRSGRLRHEQDEVAAAELSESARRRREKERAAEQRKLREVEEERAQERERYETSLQQMNDEQEKLAATVSAQKDEIAQLHEQLRAAQDALESKSSSIALVDAMRKGCAECLFESTERVLVHTRVRPVLSMEDDAGDALAVQLPNTVVLDPRSYVVHGAWTEDDSQATVFRDLCHHVDGAFDGLSCLFVAGGPALTGKTYTLFGESAGAGAQSLHDDTCRLGLVPRALARIFEVLRFRALPGWTHRVEICALAARDDDPASSTAMVDLLDDQTKQVSVVRDTLGSEFYSAPFCTRLVLADEDAAYRAFSRLACNKVMVTNGRYATLVRVSYMATDGTTQINSLLDFVELPDSSATSPLLVPFHRELHDVARCRVYTASPADCALQNLLKQTLLSRSKVVFIATLSPCKKDEAETRDTLDTAIDLSLQSDLERVVAQNAGAAASSSSGPAAAARASSGPLMATRSTVLSTVARRRANDTPAGTALRSAMGTPTMSTPLRSLPSSATGVHTTRPSTSPGSPLVTLAETSVPFVKRVGPLAAPAPAATAAAAPAAAPAAPASKSAAAAARPQHASKVLPKAPVLAAAAVSSKAAKPAGLPAQRSVRLATSAAAPRPHHAQQPQSKLPIWR